MCRVESLSPQYRHSSFVLMPNMNSSFLVISTILWIRLILNSFNIVSLQTFFSDLKILVPESCIERFSLQRLGPVWSWLGIWKKTEQFIKVSWPYRVKINLCRFIYRKNNILTGKERFFKGVRLLGYGQEVLRNGAEHLITLFRELVLH